MWRETVKAGKRQGGGRASAGEQGKMWLTWEGRTHQAELSTQAGPAQHGRGRAEALELSDSLHAIEDLECA